MVRSCNRVSEIDACNQTALELRLANHRRALSWVPAAWRALGKPGQGSRHSRWTANHTDLEASQGPLKGIFGEGCSALASSPSGCSQQCGRAYLLMHRKLSVSLGSLLKLSLTGATRALAVAKCSDITSLPGTDTSPPCPAVRT